MTKCQSPVIYIKFKYLYFQLFIYLYKFRWVLDLLSPAKIRHMHKTVYTLFQLNEQSEVCQVSHNTGMLGANGVLCKHILFCPRIFCQLLDAK